jgi:hypothetical protein
MCFHHQTAFDFRRCQRKSKPPKPNSAHVADGFHPLFAFLLLLQQPALAISPFSARFHFMSEKQLALNSIERLPEDASLDDIAERMEFLAAIRKGLDQIERGETIPHEEVKRQLAAWLSK